MRKARFITPEEIILLRKDCGNLRSGKDIDKIIYYIYERGETITSSYKKINSKVTLRALQHSLNKLTGGEITLRDLKVTYKMKNNHKKKKKYSHAPISAKLRWKVLVRDNFKCVICKRNGEDSNLQVDHIFPLSLKGKTEINNLRTLCKDCNVGRGNDIADLKLKVKQLNPEKALQSYEEYF